MTGDSVGLSEHRALTVKYVPKSGSGEDVKLATEDYTSLRAARSPSRPTLRVAELAPDQLSNTSLHTGCHR